MAKKKAQSDSPQPRTKNQEPGTAPDADAATAIADTPGPVDPVAQVDDSAASDAGETHSGYRAGAAADEIGHEAQIPLTQIFASDLNPRKTFDQAALEELADSLLRHGQLQNLTVRPVSGELYELIGGERRFRAASIACLLTIRCRVIQVDDATAIELRGIENYRRAQLNAIEEAIWFSQMIGTGRYNQTTLAEYLGITPGQVSNRLRLLKLPDDWQDRIVDGSLPATHARSLASWVDRPAVLDMVAARLQDVQPAEYTVGEFDHACLECGHDSSRSMKVGYWDGPKFELTDERLAQLDVSSITERYGSDQEDRAWNVELWDQLQAEAIEARKAGQTHSSDQDEDGQDDQDDQDSDGGSPGRDYTRSLLQDWELARVFERHVAAVMAGRIKLDAIGVRVAMLYMMSDSDLFVDWLAERQTPPLDVQDPLDVWNATKVLNPKNTLGLLVDYVQEKLTGEGRLMLTLGEMLTVCQELDLDPLAKWAPDEELLDQCSDSQLRELFTDSMAPEKQVKKWGRARLIREALDNWPPGYLPVLLKPKALLAAQAPPEETDSDDDTDDDQDDDA